jgi:hypothetical protein
MTVSFHILSNSSLITGLTLTLTQNIELYQGIYGFETRLRLPTVLNNSVVLLRPFGQMPGEYLDYTTTTSL